MNTDDHDQEWKDMKANWQKSAVSEKWMTEKLRASLRLRRLGSWAWLALEIAGFVLLLVLAGLQLALGEVGVAAAITVLNAAAAGASWWARRSPLRAAKGSLIELVDLTVERARRSVRFARAQYFTTAAVAAYVLVMFFADIGVAMAAYNDEDRVVAALIILAVYAAGVVIYHRRSLGRLRRFIELRREISPPEA